MAISTFTAARRVCGRGNWQVTNLALQKILYLAQMIYMGENKMRLIDATFEAWDYGPVEPALYHKVKFFGAEPIQDIFVPAGIDGSREAAAIDQACDFLLARSPAELVAMTHWKSGAWAKNYRPGVRGIVIPDADILEEYQARVLK